MASVHAGSYILRGVMLVFCKRVQDKVDVVKMTMQDNIQQMLANEERLDQISQNAESLNEQVRRRQDKGETRMKSSGIEGRRLAMVDKGCMQCVTKSRKTLIRKNHECSLMSSFQLLS